MFKLEELTGVLPALISPLHSDGKVDEPALNRLVEHVIDGGVRGLLALGSTGETASLDETARRTLLATVVAAADGRLPVIWAWPRATWRPRASRSMPLRASAPRRRWSPHPSTTSST